MLLWGAAGGQRCGGHGPLTTPQILFLVQSHILDKSRLIHGLAQTRRQTKPED